MVLDVYIIKFKRLKIKELSAPLGNNPRKAKEGNYKDKNRNYKTEHKNARKGRPHRTLPLVETVGLTGVRESEDRAAPAGPDGRAPTSEMLRRGTRPRKPHVTHQAWRWGCGGQAAPRPRAGASPRTPAGSRQAGGGGANSLRAAGRGNEDPPSPPRARGCRVGCGGTAPAHRSRGPTP